MSHFHNHFLGEGSELQKKLVAAQKVFFGFSFSGLFDTIGWGGISWNFRPQIQSWSPGLFPEDWMLDSSGWFNWREDGSARPLWALCALEAWLTVGTPLAWHGQDHLHCPKCHKLRSKETTRHHLALLHWKTAALAQPLRVHLQRPHRKAKPKARGKVRAAKKQQPLFGSQAEAHPWLHKKVRTNFKLPVARADCLGYSGFIQAVNGNVATVLCGSGPVDFPLEALDLIEEWKGRTLGFAFS